MIVEIKLLTGRFHATAWGRHVNEAVPEWPPSPFRLLRAALDAWYRKHIDLPAPVVEQLMRALAVPPVFRLPRARASHTRAYLSQNKENPTDKQPVFDGFAVVDRGETLLVGWPGVRLDADLEDVARRLFGSLNYLGRSETWIAAKVMDDREVAWNCTPLAEGVVPDQTDVVSVAGVVSPVTYDERPFEIPARGKTKARRLPWMEALTWGSAEAMSHTMNRPPALEPIFYARAKNSLDARPTPPRRTSTRVVDSIRFSVGGRVKAPITDALVCGEQVRRNLMGSLKRVTGDEQLSSTFSGKDAAGNPVRGHVHVSILSLDEDGDGFIDTLIITSPKPLTTSEQRAVDRIRPIPRRNGHSLVLTPLRYGTRDELLSSSTTVVSGTPFAPSQHWRLKRDGDLDAWLTKQVALECEWRSLPTPTKVERIGHPEVQGRTRRWLDFRRSRKDDSPQPAYGLRVTFREPVLAPFSLGYASHFGLGLFVAE